VILPLFVQSGLLRSAEGFHHAFLGIDPLPGRGEEELLRSVFSVPPDRIGVLRQVHSGIALEREEGDAGIPGGGRREGDALWTAEAGTGVGVFTADCVPILLAHPGLGLCGAIHAGWRGLAAGVVESTVESIAARFGGSVTGGFLAAAGPAARGCCYEIGEEVADLLRRRSGGGRRLRKGHSPDRWMADLPLLAADALAGSGIPRERLETAGPCTVCSRDFHSWRREKSLTGRQLGFIYRMENPGGDRNSHQNRRDP